MKKQIIIFIGVLLVLTPAIFAFEFNEDNEGNSFYEADALIKAPSINVRDLFILQPSSEPFEPELGMIYFDVDSKRLKIYDGSGWYSLALEKVSSVSKKQVKETVEEKSEVQSCESSVECDDWGDCINNYQTMTCITTDEACNKYTDAETRDCVSDSPFQEEIEEAQEEPIEETEEEQEEEEAEEEEEPEEEASEEEEEVEEEEPEEAPAEEAIPEELFDITFDLEESVLGKSDKLVIWITLQNFGKRYVPARLVYSVTDEEGEEVYREFEEVRVYTDESIIKRFDNLILEQGDYVLSMSVEYAGIVEEFSDDFSVETGFFGSIRRFFARLF